MEFNDALLCFQNLQEIPKPFTSQVTFMLDFFIVAKFEVTSLCVPGLFRPVLWTSLETLRRHSRHSSLVPCFAHNDEGENA